MEYQSVADLGIPISGFPMLARDVGNRGGEGNANPPRGTSALYFDKISQNPHEFFFIFGLLGSVPEFLL